MKELKDDLKSTPLTLYGKPIIMNLYFNHHYCYKNEIRYVIRIVHSFLWEHGADLWQNPWKIGRRIGKVGREEYHETQRYSRVLSSSSSVRLLIFIFPFLISIISLMMDIFHFSASGRGWYSMFSTSLGTRSSTLDLCYIGNTRHMLNSLIFIFI